MIPASSPFLPYRQLAFYNQWANQSVLAILETLPAEVLWQPRPAFFGSIMGTLNHLIVGDRLWLGRISKSLDMSWFTGLDQIVHRDFAALREERCLLDQRYCDILPSLAVDEALSYLSSQKVPFVRPMGIVLSHIFNHQTHHRGQVHDMLSQCGVETPVLDLLYCPLPPELEAVPGL